MTLKRITADSFRNGGMRGVVGWEAWSGPRPDADWDAAKAIGADHLRVWVNPVAERSGYVIDDAQLRTLDGFCKQAQARGLHLVLTLGMDGDRGLPWRSGLAQSLTKVWADLAARYRNRLAFAGFDLFNEPLLEFVAEYWTWVEETVAAIRAIDPQRVCIVELCPDAHPNWPDTLPVKAIEGVVYSVHSYSPHRFTHSDMADWARPPMEYSDDVLSVLHRSLLPARRWQREHGVPIYVGEFSALNTLPGHERYIEHSADLFRGFGWSWAYHAWRAWPGWDAEAVYTDKAGGYVRSDTAPAALALRDAFKAKA